MAIPMRPYSYDHYSQFFLPPSPHPQPTYTFSPSPPAIMHHQDAMPPQSQSPTIPLDPNLAIYPNQYFTYQQPPRPHLPPHLTMPLTYPSPTSQASDTIGTPPIERRSPPSISGNKRPSPTSANDARKKARKDEDDDGPSSVGDKEEKVKPTRGSRACTVCRRLKMKCVGAEQGPPCKRCLTGNHECIFEESNRGKRSSKKHELLTRSLRKMERTLDTVLRSIGNPGITSGMISRSPTPSAQTVQTQALLSTPSPPPSSASYEPSSQHPPGSPILHSLPDNSLNPLGLLAEASLANRRALAAKMDPNTPMASRTNSVGEKKLGVASDNYFKPGPINILPLRRLYIERQVQPEMLSFVSTDEVVALFKIYFDHLNMQCSLLDPDFHTPSLVCSRSPFLLTTICSISAKFYPARPELQSRLQDLAKKLAFNVPASGYKSVEIVQAYLLLSLWGCGAVERYEQDKTWLLLGMAIRMATDLNLHRKTAVPTQDTPEGRARDREVHNREKTWLICFCLDRSLSAQMGKPHSIKEDHIIRNADSWFRAPIAQPTDSSIAAYAGLQRLLSRSLDLLYSGTSTPSGLQMHCDYLLVIKTLETQFYAWRDQWFGYRDTVHDEPDPVLHYKRLITRFYYNYAMLVLNSFGLQNALERSAVDIGHFFARVHSSAMACALLIRDELGPSGFLKYSPDSHFVFTSYAVLSLLKLIRPEFRPFMENEAQTLQLVKDVADVLESVAANQHHTPALYGAFLRALLSARLDSAAAAGGSHGLGGSPTVMKMEATMSPSVEHNNGSTSNFLGLNMPGNPPLGGALSDFHLHFDGEMGPVADMSTFPPTMAPVGAGEDVGMLSMDSIFSNGFWDSVLVPGYSNAMEGISGGFVYGAHGSGLITPGFGSPAHSPAPSPVAQSSMGATGSGAVVAEMGGMGVAFGHSPQALGMTAEV